MDGDVCHLIVYGHWDLATEWRARAPGRQYTCGHRPGILAMYSNNYHTLAVDLTIPILNGSVAFLPSLWWFNFTSPL